MGHKLTATEVWEVLFTQYEIDTGRKPFHDWAAWEQWVQENITTEQANVLREATQDNGKRLCSN